MFNWHREGAYIHFHQTRLHHNKQYSVFLVSFKLKNGGGRTTSESTSTFCSTVTKTVSVENLSNCRFKSIEKTHFDKTLSTSLLYSVVQFFNKLYICHLWITESSPDIELKTLNQITSLHASCVRFSFTKEHPSWKQSMCFPGAGMHQPVHRLHELSFFNRMSYKFSALQYSIDVIFRRIAVDRFYIKR